MKKQIIFFGITVLTIFTGCFSANRCFAEETWFSEYLADCMKSLEDDFAPSEDDMISLGSDWNMVLVPCKLTQQKKKL